MSLRSVADKVGFSHVFLAEVERGLRPLPASRAAALAEIYQVTAEEVLRMAPPNRLDLSDLGPEDRLRVAALADALRAAGRAA